LQVKKKNLYTLCIWSRGVHHDLSKVNCFNYNQQTVVTVGFTMWFHLTHIPFLIWKAAQLKM